MAKAGQRRFYFSFRSPYSWLAYRDLLDRHAGAADRLSWIPYWDPDERSQELLAADGHTFPYTVMSRAKHLYVLQDVARLTGDRGLAVTWPVDRDPVWEVPHLAYLVAQREGEGREFIRRVYRARWEEGRDICDPATIAAIGADLALDRSALVGAPTDPQLRRRGADCLAAACRDGAFGVPFFVHGRRRYWGLDRLERFVAELPAPPAEPAAATAVPAGGRSSDDGHAGGCG